MHVKYKGPIACSIIEIAWLHPNSILKIVIAYRLFEVGAIQLFLQLTGGNSILIPSFYDVPPSRYFNCVQENVYLHLLIAILGEIKWRVRIIM